MATNKRLPQTDRQLADWLDQDGRPITVTVLIDDDGKAWYPIPNLCRAFWVDARYWSDKLRENDDIFEGQIAQFRVGTAGGEQDTWCIEREVVPMLLVLIAMSKKANPAARRRLIPFTKLVVKLAAAAFNSRVVDAHPSPDGSTIIPIGRAVVVANGKPQLALVEGNGGNGLGRRVTDLEAARELDHERFNAIERDIANVKRLLGEE